MIPQQSFHSLYINKLSNIVLSTTKKQLISTNATMSYIYGKKKATKVKDNINQLNLESGKLRNADANVKSLLTLAHWTYTEDV